MTACPDCGSLREMAPDKPRSTRQHRRFFAVLNQVYLNWSHRHEFQPKSVDHLRYWLEVQAGHYKIVRTIQVQSVNPVALEALLVAVLLSSDSEDTFVELEGTQITVKRSLSISYHKLGHLSACALFNDIDAVIARETHTNIGQFLREFERAGVGA